MQQQPMVITETTTAQNYGAYGQPQGYAPNAYGQQPYGGQQIYGQPAQPYVQPGGQPTYAY